MVEEGLVAAGYVFIQIDDCWAAKERDASGAIVPDPVRFPSGMKSLADYVHSKGMKLGISNAFDRKTPIMASTPSHNFRATLKQASTVTSGVPRAADSSGST